MKEWRRRLLATSFLSVYDLVFQYTGSWDDSYYTSDDDGVEYRLLTLKTDGTLTFDPAMLNRFSFDMWVIAGGGKGGSGSEGTSYRTTTWSSLDGSGISHPKECGGSVAEVSSGNRGNTGGDGGWSQKNKYVTSYPKAVVNSGSGNNDVKINGETIVSAVAGADATNFKDGISGTRTGTQWFSTSYGNGGAGGEGPTHYRCDCGASETITKNSAGSIGKKGVVYIRIPTNQ